MITVPVAAAVDGELLLLDRLEAVAKVKLGCLLLQVGVFVLILGGPFQRWLDAENKPPSTNEKYSGTYLVHTGQVFINSQFPLEVIDSKVELIDLKVFELHLLL